MTAARVASVATALLCAGTAIYLQLGAQSAGLARDASELAAAGRLDEAITTARRVDRAPADLRAMLVEARAHAQQGRSRDASRLYARVAERDPNNWIVQLEWARATFATEPERALERLRRAKELNPRLPAPALEAAN